MISLCSLFLHIKQYHVCAGCINSSYYEFYVGFTYWERHATILPLRDASVATKCFVCVAWVTGSYFLNGMFFIYDAVRWKPNETLLANFISVSLSLSCYHISFP